MIQPLTGGNSGFSTINYNGYYNGGEQRYNTAKNRWRVGTEQRNTSDLFFIDTYNGTSGFTPFAILNNGNVGISNSNPAYTLDVTGTINASGQVRAGGTVLTSDLRLKRNITPSAYGLATVLGLRPVQYEKKATIQSTSYDRHEIGFIAQDVQKLLPTLVSEGTDIDKTLAVSYTELIPVLTKAIQEQQAQIEALKSQNAALQARTAQADADHASLLTLQAQMARLLGETAPVNAQAHK